MTASMDLGALDRDLTGRLAELGISRLADTTGLDRIGIPTHACVRPDTPDSIWVYSGKGATPEASRISAIMECVERTCALWSPAAVQVAHRCDLGSRWPVWGAERFTERSACDEGRPAAWVLAHRLRGGHVWVPAEQVFLGVPPDIGAHLRISARTSNGLAAAFSREEAIIHALEELIERDAVSCAELRASHSGATILGGMAEALGLDVAALLGGYRDDVDLAITIDPATLPESSASIVRRFAAIGVEVTVKYIPNDFGIPVFGAAAIEEMSFDNLLAAAGYAASLDSSEAVHRALLELAQSRATDLQGAREDCGYEEKGRLRVRPVGHWLAAPGRRQSFAALPWGSRAPRLQRYLRALASVGLSDVAYFPFNSVPGIHVVRVLVPDIETWHATAGESRLGARMARALDWRSP